MKLIRKKIIIRRDDWNKTLSFWINLMTLYVIGILKNGILKNYIGPCLQIFKTDPKLSPFKKAHKTQAFRIEFRVQTLQFTPSPELRPRTRALEFSLHTSLSLSLSKMWASAEGGPPEVTLETSMGSFTVEVLPLLFNSLLFVCSESHRKSNKVINWVFFFLFFIINVILFWLLKFECEIN